VALDAALPPRSRSLAISQGLTARVGLTAIVAVSFFVRVVASAAHSVPRLFPDEYIYTMLARSIAEGHGATVRGAPAHFPALLTPLVAAPLQALASPIVAYHLTQAENALFMSLAAIPVYVIARRVGLNTTHGLLCAAFAVAIPDLVFSSYTLSDPVAYPLVLTTFAVGLAALVRPTAKTQLAFLGLSGLTVFARVQYVVIPVAFLVAACVLDRRGVLRKQRLVLIACALPLVAVLGLGPAHVLGYYSRISNQRLNLGVLTWAGVSLFLLAFASGMVLVPGALVGLLRPKGRTERAFALLTGVLSICLLIEASLYSANGSTRFHERYLFALLPLVPIAFGLYAKHGRPYPRAVTAVSVVLLVLSQRIPLSGYIAGLGKVDSPFLVAVSSLQPTVSIGATSLLVAILAALTLGGALLVAWRGGATVALTAAVAISVVVSVGAVVQDSRESNGVHTELVPTPFNWVDEAHVGPVTLLQTQGAQLPDAVEQMYFNRSIMHEAILGDHPDAATDVFGAPRLKLDADGRVLNATNSILVQNWGATVRFQNASVVAHAHTWSLWSSQGTPQLSVVEDGRYFDDWLARQGRLTVWPDASGHTRGFLTFTLFLPRGQESKPVTIRFGKNHYRVVPGQFTHVVFAIDSPQAFRLNYSAGSGRWLQDFRSVSVKSTVPLFHRAPSPPATSPA
jgi:hypothetical protein